MISSLFTLIYLLFFQPLKNIVNFFIPLKFKAKNISKEIILVSGAGIFKNLVCSFSKYFLFF